MGEVIAGLAQGYGQGQFAAKKQKENEEMRKAQTKLYELQLKQGQDKQNAIDELTAATTPQTGAGPVEVTEKPDILDILSSNPALAIRSGFFDGGDLLKARAQQQQNQLISQFTGGGSPGTGSPSGFTTGLSFGPSGTTIKLDPTQVGDTAINPNNPSETLVYDKQGNLMSTRPTEPNFQRMTFRDGSGNTREAFVDINRGSSQGSSGGSQNAPVEGSPSGVGVVPEGRNKPLTTSEATLFRDKNGNPATVGMSAADAQARGFKPVTSKEVERLSSVDRAVDIVNQAQLLALGDGEASRGVFTEEKYRGRLKLGAKTLANDILNFDPEISAYRDFVSSNAGAITKALGESGSLTEGDKRDGAKAVADLTGVPDSRSAAEAKFNRLLEILQRAKTPSPFRTEQGSSNNSGQGTSVDFDFTQ